MTRLEQLRLDALLTRADLAAATGVGEETIRQAEVGETTRPRIATLGPLARYFDVPASSLLAPRGGGQEAA